MLIEFTYPSRNWDTRLNHSVTLFDRVVMRKTSPKTCDGRFFGFDRTRSLSKIKGLDYAAKRTGKIINMQ